MPIVFQLEKPTNMLETLQKLEIKLAKEGGSISGNEVKGVIEYSGVEGIYIVKNDSIEIGVIKCPLIHRPFVEKYIRSIFKEVKS